VAIEGVTVLPNFDIFAECGYQTACDKTFIIDLADGQFNIDITSIMGITGQPGIIAAIEILQIPPETPEALLCFITKWGGYGSGDGQFSYPRGIAVDSSGNVYVADTSNNRIQKFDSNGNYITQWGSFGSGDGEFIGPRGIAVDGSGNVYVTDSSNNRIQKFDSNGMFLNKWGIPGTGDGEFDWPVGIAVDSGDNVYVADYLNYRIQMFDSGGNYITQWGSHGGGDGQFRFPNGVAVDNSGYIYVADTLRHDVQKFGPCEVTPTVTPTTTAISTATPTYTITLTSTITPTATLTLTPAATECVEVYVSDTLNNRIQVFDSEGNYLRQWNVAGQPLGITVSGDGEVFVVDTPNNRVQVFDECGLYLRQWGLEGSGNGEFAWPRDIVISNNGNAYITDYGNNRVQVFGLAGNYLFQWSGCGDEGESFYPWGITADNNNDVFVVDYGNRRVVRFDEFGVCLAQWGDELDLQAPLGITAGQNGYIYFTDVSRNNVRVVDNMGTEITQWGSFGTGPGEFNHPHAIAAGNDMICVVDSSNQRIQVFDMSGNFITSFGNEGSGNGEFNNPLGIAVGRCAVCPPTVTATFTASVMPTLTPTYTPTPTITPTPAVTETAVPSDETKDCAINWLHTMQGVEFNGIMPSDPEYGSWAFASGGYNRDYANVGVTSMVLLGYINEYTYDLFTDFPNNTAPNWVTLGVFNNDPSFHFGLGYIRNNIHSAGYISDMAKTFRADIRVYDTSLALAVLAAYRQVLKATGMWASSAHGWIEEAMYNGHAWLLSVQNIEPAHTDAEPLYGGWGYPRENWSDLSNTQFAVWALKALELATDSTANTAAYPLDYPGPGTALAFTGARKDAAAKFLFRCTSDPSTVRDWNRRTMATDLGVIRTANGSLYQPEGMAERCAYTLACGAYGSITAASFWSGYCLDYPFMDGFFPLSSAQQWNTMLWLEANYDVTQNTGDIDFPARWYWYYVMTAMKAFHMNIVTGLNWYDDFKNHLENIVDKPAPVLGYPCTYFWESIGYAGEESRPFNTAAAVLGLVTQPAHPVFGTMLEFVLGSPGEIYITDAQGWRAGCVNGAVITEIPGALVEGCAVVKLQGPRDGIYTAVVRGTAEGEYTITARSYLQGGIMQQESGVGRITAGSEHSYKVSLGRVFWPMTISTEFLAEVLPEPTATPVETPTVTATATPTMTLTPTITPVPVPASVRLQYHSYNTNQENNTLFVNFRVYNEDTKNIEMSGITVKYWYTFEGAAQNESAVVDWAGKLPSGEHITQYVTTQIQAIEQSGQTRVQISGFTEAAGSIAPAEYGQVQLRIHKNDWSNYTQTNDYSFGTQSEFIDWIKMTVYYNGVKVWGLEPGEVGYASVPKHTPTPVIGKKMSALNTFNYPNPCGGRTTIRFSLDEPQEVRIAVYDINSGLVWQRNMGAEETRTGVNYVVWDAVNEAGAPAANGIYLLRVASGDVTVTKKIAVIR